MFPTPATLRLPAGLPNLNRQVRGTGKMNIPSWSLVNKCQIFMNECPIISILLARKLWGIHVAVPPSFPVRLKPGYPKLSWIAWIIFLVSYVCSQMCLCFCIHAPGFSSGKKKSKCFFYGKDQDLFSFKETFYRDSVLLFLCLCCLHSYIDWMPYLRLQ